VPEDGYFLHVNRIVATSAVALLALAGCGSSSDPSSSATASSETSATVAPVVELLACPSYETAVNAGTVKDSELDELSGLAASSHAPNTFWTHNDSGDSARVFTIDGSGKRLATFDLDDIGVFDAEDIAVSPGDDPRVWLADIGDNFRFRGSVQLYHFAEPADPASDATVEAKELNVKYAKPNGNGTVSVDAESFFIDRAGNGYIVEKTSNQQLAWVFQITAEDMKKTSTVTAEPIVQITGNTNGKGYGPTGADLSRDGTTLAIKNYTETFVWRFTATSPIAEVLSKQPSSSCVVKAGRGEAITFDNQDLLTVEEGTNKPLRRTKAK
jgi:hypothetical protein